MREETMKPKTYKIPENLKRKVDVQIDELLELGLIEPVTVYSNFAKIALPLTELTKRKSLMIFHGARRLEMLSRELKTALCGITELQVPDIEKPYYLHTDASQTAVGCCLGQLDGEDNIHPHSLWGPETEPKPTKVVNN
ncbi:hypothetical protein TNCV_4973391 [Trichonephila clavipes]|uniref:Reverse transcriptase/retrotransposon-derived protein RNase H-like domain-containing protein n=1 Tax=Trichonephila clavipes TaxID=2585209 RepID=A0A8X6VGH3_TRICX|nr:hypothetical protein TNCV_4973391 [Trichonephila clavipes]